MTSKSAISRIASAADPSGVLDLGTKQYVDNADAAGDLNAARTAEYPMDQYGIVALSMPIDSIAIAQSVSVNTIEICRIYVPANKIITGAAVNVATAGTVPGAVNDSGFCLYADDGQSQLGKTVNDYTIFTTAGWRSKAFPSPIAAQALGRFLRIAMLHTCTTVLPKFGASASTASGTWNFMLPSGTHRRQIFATSTLTFPATFLPASFGTNDNPLLCLALY